MNASKVLITLVLLVSTFMGGNSATAEGTIEEVLTANAPRLTEYLDSAMIKMGEWVEATESLATEQVPLLIKEIIYWGIADAGFGVGLGLIFMLCLPATIFFLGRSKTLPEGERCMGAAFDDKGSDFDVAFSAVGGIVLPIVGFLVFLCHIMSFLKPIVAPRLYLVEYFRQLAG